MLTMNSFEMHRLHSIVDNVKLYIYIYIYIYIYAEYLICDSTTFSTDISADLIVYIYTVSSLHVHTSFETIWPEYSARTFGQND